MTIYVSAILLSVLQRYEFTFPSSLISSTFMRAIAIPQSMEKLPDTSFANIQQEEHEGGKPRKYHEDRFLNSPRY